MMCAAAYKGRYGSNKNTPEAFAFRGVFMIAAARSNIILGYSVLQNSFR